MLETYRIRRTLTAAALAGVMLLATACASAPPAAPASLKEAKLAIEVAEKVDANHHATAELDEARQKLVSADKSVMAKNMVLADRFAKQPIVMAELATAKTEAAKAQAVNEELKRGSKALIEEMQRIGDQQ
jgi:DMSO/TMAO reductase YedYZ molybdopterin-dependent catalytic subunit